MNARVPFSTPPASRAAAELTASSQVECSISVMWPAGRPVVHCDVQHFISSGMAVDEVFALVRPDFETVIRQVAARDPGGALARRPVAVELDVGEEDAGLELVINDVAACMADMDGSMAKLLAIFASVVAAERAGGAA